MKRQFSNFIILINILSFCFYCLSDETLLHEVDINHRAILEEITAIFNILTSEEQANNEDINLNITQMGDKYGYPIDEYHVNTDDGYILTMFRIQKNGPVVFLMHGLLMSADDWVTAGSNDSLAYLLATAGYDVWMGNSRGNKHSRKHISLSPNNPKFWDFSWDDIGRIDLPAMIDYVLKITGKTQLGYIGYSQGTTTFFVMCSERPDYNKKISTMIALAPIAYTSHMKSPLVRSAALFHYYESVIAKMFHTYEILPKPIDYLYMNTPLCGIGNGIICITLLFFSCGFDYEQVNVKNLPVILNHLPSGASVFQFIHYFQNIATGSFSKYDHGEKKNKQLYGSSTPPQYIVKNVRVPIAIFYSDNDWFADVKDVTTLKNKLPNVRDFYRVPLKKFNHIDFLWAKDVNRLIHARILELLRFDNKTLGTL